MPASEDWITLRIADTIGGLIEFWGFKRPMGRMWAILYLSEEPMSAAELGERLAMSSGAVSMTVGELIKWGVVKKTWVPGERKDFYAPETSVWKMVSRVFRERELAQIRGAIETFEQAIAELGKRDKKRVKVLVDKIESLLALARVGDALLSAVLDGRKIDLGPIREFSGA
ncbi:MAG TPA: MarR family transcriptional regulator [Haliangiales bacterium]|nr:MarR family transcriptional regulator [Haliangiales bacterium]